MNALDRSITVFVGKLAEAAPPAVDFERLADPRSARTTSTGRPLLTVAVVALVALGLAAVVQVRTADRGTTASSFEPSRSPVIGMPFAVVPRELPDGWRFVDVFDSGESPPADPSSSFLFREPTTRAAIYVQTWPLSDDPNPGPFRDLRESFASSGAATFAVDGSFVWMRIAGIDTDTGVALAESLVLDDAGPDRVPQFPARSGFVLESSRSIGDASTARGAVAQLRMRTPNGTVDIVLDTRDPDNSPWNHYGVPSTVGGREVYTSPYSVTGDPIDGVVTAAVQVSNPVDLDGAAALFASLERAPLEAWDDIEDRIAAEVSQVPVVDRLEIRDVSVSRHEGPTMTAICATWQGATRCRSDESPLWGGGDPIESANLVVDGLWVTAGSIDSDMVTRFDIAPAQGVEGRRQSGNGRTFFAYVVLADAGAVQIDFDSDGPSGQFGFDRRPAR